MGPKTTAAITGGMGGALVGAITGWLVDEGTGAGIGALVGGTAMALVGVSTVQAVAGGGTGTGQLPRGVGRAVQTPAGRVFATHGAVNSQLMPRRVDPAQGLGSMADYETTFAQSGQLVLNYAEFIPAVPGYYWSLASVTQAMVDATTWSSNRMAPGPGGMVLYRAGTAGPLTGWIVVIIGVPVGYYQPLKIGAPPTPRGGPPAQHGPVLSDAAHGTGSLGAVMRTYAQAGPPPTTDWCDRVCETTPDGKIECHLQGPCQGQFG